MAAGGIFTTIVAPALDGVSKIIGQFHMSPEEKAQALQAIEDEKAKAVQSSRDYEVQLNTIAGQNIRADADSGDKFAARARPMFMYIIEAILIWNYIGLSIFKACGAKDVGPAVLPGDLLTLFGVCVTGYVFARSADKAMAGLALPGTTTVSVAGGLLKGSNTPPGN